jgi:hypothetical protein
MAKLNVYYDLRVSPITFDAAVFFATAIAAAKLQGFNRYSINIVASAFRNITPRELSYDLAQRRWRLNNIILPLAKLLPSVESVALWQGSEVALSGPRYPGNYDPARPIAPSYGFPGLIEVARAGGDVQPFESSEYASAWARGRLSGSSSTIVMAIRAGDFNQNRDSRLAEWFELYRHLTGVGFRVLVIPDQYDVLYGRKAWEFDWELVPEAAIDLDLRLALYQQCAANIAWTGGHTALMWLSKSRFLIFGSWNEKNHVSSREWYERQGVAVGSEPIFLIPGRQKFDWLEAGQVTARYMIDRSEQFLRGIL